MFNSSETTSYCLEMETENRRERVGISGVGHSLFKCHHFINLHKGSVTHYKLCKGQDKEFSLLASLCPVFDFSQLRFLMFSPFNSTSHHVLHYPGLVISGSLSSEACYMTHAMTLTAGNLKFGSQVCFLYNTHSCGETDSLCLPWESSSFTSIMDS